MAVGWLVQEPVIHDGNLWLGRQTPKVIQWLLCGVGEVQLQNAELIIDFFFNRFFFPPYCEANNLVQVKSNNDKLPVTCW